MALINGNDYDHIDFTKNGVTTRHMLKDTLSRQMSGDLVKVQNEEPTSEGTKIWIKPSGDSEVQVPTYEEFEELSEKIDDADATIESLAVGAQPTVSVTEVDGHKRFSFSIPASNGIASITKTATDGVIDTYTIAMTDGTSTSFSVNNSDITPESMAEAIATALQDYARIDGYYPDLTAGNADQLNSTKFVENKEPYLYRPSGGTSDIGNRKYLDAIVGVSLPWNQMVRDEASENQTDFADIVTVTDAVEDAAGVKVKIEPVQDLHGYDHPWPAGGGKNLWPYESLTMPDYNTRLYEGQYPEVFAMARRLTPGAKYRTGSDTSTGGSTFTALNIYYSDGTSAFIRSASMSGTIADLSNGSIAIESINVQLGTADGTGERTSYKMVLEQTTTSNPAYTPYENICPITGWTAARINRTGKNLFDNVWEIGIISNTTGENMPGNAHVRCKNYIPCKNGQYIYMGWDTTATGSVYMLVMVYGVDGSFKRYAGARISPFSLKLNDDEHFIRFYLYNRTDPLVNPYIVYGTTASDYEPYAGQVYDITFPTEAGTVYGGSLTISEDGSGVLTVDRGMVNMGSMVWNYNTTYAFFISNSISTRKIGVLNVWSDLFKTMAGSWSGTPVQNALWGNGSNATSYVQTPPLDNVNDFMALVDGHQLMYELATPITYTLTASEIRTLLGTNHIWADTGDLALTYTGTDEHLTLESGKKYLARLSGTDSMLLGSGQEITAAKGTDNVFDLTKMFGTSVADYVCNQGAGYFRQWFGKTWYPYNTGELKHVEGLQSHDLVGFNLWDEEWELGTYTTSSGQKATVDNQIRCKNPIPLIPGVQYCAKGITWCGFYDDNLNTIKVPDVGFTPSARANNAVLFNSRKQVFTAPADAAYMWFYNLTTYGTTYKHDICIHLAHNGSRNGEYEPYEKQSHPLDNTVILRGVPKLIDGKPGWDGDRYLPDGTVERRYGVVDLGTLDWLKHSSLGYLYAKIEDQAKPLFDTSNVDVVCKMYLTYTVRDIQYASTIKGISIGKTGFFDQYVIVKDPEVVDIATFKAAMSGVLLVYELETPIIEQALPYRNFQLVDDWGTEEFVTTGMIPVGHESRYPANLRDKLQHLPDAASSNGSYLITQTDGQMTLTPFPAPPTTAGKYVLRATVTNGVATFTWEATT